MADRNGEGLVSIIVPAFNRASLIPETLRSVQDQTCKRFEVLVIDDGSTDATADAVRSVCASDSRFRYHYQENRGAAAARNRGIELSNGEFIAFLDSDDLWLPQKLERQMDVFRKSPQTGFVYCNGYYIDETGARNEELTRRARATRHSVENILFDRISFFSTSGVMFRKACLEKAGRFDEQFKLLEDVDLWFRILLHHEGHFLDEDLVINRKHESNYIRHSTHPSVDMARSLVQFRVKAVPLFEKEVRRLSDRERQAALDPPRVDLIKELLAWGLAEEGRKEILSYRASHPRSLRAFFYLSLTWLPSGLVSRIIQARRKWLL